MPLDTMREISKVAEAKHGIFKQMMFYWLTGKLSASALFLFKESEKKGQDLMFIIGLCASTPPSPPSQLREIGVSIFPLSHNMTSKINPKCKKGWRLDAKENQDWQNRGSGVEGRGGPVIVSGKMVWQQLIRLAELWLSNEQHPPLSQTSHYAVNHEHTRYEILYSCSAPQPD